jgi:tetratricopeptide (TPR) repeat protein
VEKVYPERAVPCAERLAALMPGAGHLVHMPGHVYIRVGRYLEAVQANEHAVHADETYIRDQQPGMGMYTAGYYPHNYDFLAFAAMMIGRSGASVAAAENVTGLLPEEIFGSPGMDFLQHWTVRPLQLRVRFARWDEILATPEPRESFPHARAIWHYARGRAFVARGDVPAAERELERVRALREDPRLDGVRMEFNASGDLLAIADRVLAAWTAVAAGRWEEAVASAREAVRLEDALFYGEPPEWTVPTRQDLGAVLLAAGRASEAEQAFRADLERFPENGWSLRGLSLALRAQGRASDAAAADRDFRRVWATADVDPPTFAAR